MHFNLLSALFDLRSSCRYLYRSSSLRRSPSLESLTDIMKQNFNLEHLNKKPTCLKKLETVSVTGRKLSRLIPISSPTEDQLLLLSWDPPVPRLSKDPRRDQEPDPVSTPVFLRN